MKIEVIRPERWRYLRLLDLVEKAERAALNGDHASLWPCALSELSDGKGDLTAHWADEAVARLFHTLIDEAWAGLDKHFEDIVHSYPDPAAPGGCRSFVIERADIVRPNHPITGS